MKRLNVLSSNGIGLSPKRITMNLLNPLVLKRKFEHPGEFDENLPINLSKKDKNRIIQQKLKVFQQLNLHYFIEFKK